MKRIVIMFMAVLAVAALRAQSIADFESAGMECTSITVGKKASADGSVMTSH